MLTQHAHKHSQTLSFQRCRYEFSWEPNGAASSSPHAPIKCITRQGIIGPGRQFEMIFEYTPQADVPTETFWVSLCYVRALSCTLGTGFCVHKGDSSSS